MADRRQTLRTDVVVDTGKAEGELKGLGRAADKASVDVGQLAKELKDAKRPAQDLAREAHDTGGVVSDAMDNSKDATLGAASAMGEAFGQGGSATDAIGSFGEVVEGVAEAFGPFGPAVAAAGGFILGMFTQASDKAAELKARADEVFGALVSGAGQLDEAFKQQAIQDFITNNKDLVTQVSALLGPGGLKDLGDAVSGDEAAYQRLNGRVETTIAQMKQEKHDLEALQLSGVPLTKQQQQRLELLNQQIPVYEELNTQIDDQAGAIGIARQELNLYNGMVGNTTSSMGAYTTAQGYVIQGLYDTKVAADLAKRGINGLQDAINKRNARGTAPEGNVSYIEGRNGAAGHWVYNSGPNIGKTVPGRASGGPVEAGRAYTVGEYGKETFVPATDGTIVPNGGAVGGSVTVNQTIVANDPIRVAQQTSEALRRAQWRMGR